MIHFYELPREEEQIRAAFRAEGIEELVESLLALDLPDERYALSSGCLCTMYLADGEVLLALPQPYTEEGSVEGALSELEEFIRHADLPMQYVGVTKEEFPLLISRYRHTNVDLIDRADETFRVSVLTEPMLFAEIPEICGERITLCPIDETDEDMLLCLENDEESVRYFRDERDLSEKGAPLAMLQHEREHGISIPLSIRVDGKPVGNLALYAFDGKGGAEVAVRILPEHRRLGYAREALECAFCFAEGILSLTHLDGVVKIENTPSLSLCGSIMTEIQNDGERVVFRRTFAC